MSDLTILTADGRRFPPSWFTQALERFDANLRCVWGMGQGAPFPGWVIERRIPAELRDKVYNDPAKPGNRERFAFQIVTENGKPVAKRLYDMMPEWLEVYRIMNARGEPILELGEFVIDYLRKNYERTLLGHPELGAKHLREDRAAKEARDEQKRQQTIDNAARAVMDRKYDIFSDVLAFGGQPDKVKEGTDFNADSTGNA